MSYEPLTFERANQLLDEALAERGADFNYVDHFERRDADGTITGCYYVEGDQPGCIAGYVLHKHGVPLDELASVEGDSVANVMTDLEITDGFFTSRVNDLLSYCQEKQDVGVTWGAAVAHARRMVSR